MDRERNFPEGLRRGGEEAPFYADEVIYERDPLGQGGEVPAIDEVIHEEPAPAPKSPEMDPSARA